MPVHQRYFSFESDQRKFFNELITEDWETYHSAQWDFTRTFEIQKLFERVKPAQVLDIGCGVGFHDLVMADYSFVSEVDAFDYSDQSIIRANSEYPHPKVNRFVADIETFVPTKKYDLIVSFQVFEHLANPDKYLDFCSKYIKPGGIVAIYTPNRMRWDNLMLSFEKKPAIMIDIMHFREYTSGEIFQLGKNHHLKPLGKFGHTWHTSNLLRFKLIREMSFQKRTMLGYIFPNVAKYHLRDDEKGIINVY